MYDIHRPQRIPLKDFDEWFDSRCTGEPIPSINSPESLGESDNYNIVRLFPSYRRSVEELLLTDKEILADLKKGDLG